MVLSSLFVSIHGLGTQKKGINVNDNSIGHDRSVRTGFVLCRGARNSCLEDDPMQRNAAGMMSTITTSRFNHAGLFALSRVAR
jgi:hypothetical protein